MSMNNIYSVQLIEEKIHVDFIDSGNDMEDYFLKYAVTNIEGKCRNEGYIKKNSCKVSEYSAGKLESDFIIYKVKYICEVCYPHIDMEVICKINSINNSIGMRAFIDEEENNPMTIYISNELNPNVDISNYNEGQMVKIKINGHRFDRNDKTITVLGEIIT